MQRLLPVSLLPLLCAACVGKASTQVSSGQTWFWDNYENGSDADIVQAVNMLDALPTVHGVNANTQFMGTISVLLQPSDLATVMLQGVNDPSQAPGLLAVTEMNCTLDQVEPLLYATQQAKIHSGDYDSYDRTYTSSLTDYQARKTEFLTWQSTMSVTDVGAKYTDTVFGGLRRIPAQSASTFGPIILSRTWLPKPATSLNEGSSFTQDYQIEVYYERSPGKVIHSFGDWRDIHLATSLGQFTVSDPTDQMIILNNDVSWDQNTATQCSGSAQYATSSG
jgi:hypothetical protein